MDEIQILKTRLRMSQSQTLFERQKRQLHSRRVRHLLGRVVKAVALEENNAAMKDQLTLRMEEITSLRQSLVRGGLVMHTAYKKHAAPVGDIPY